VINKADIDPQAAKLAKRQFVGALSMLRSTSANWRPPVVALSAATSTGIDEFWDQIEKFQTTMTGTGEFQERRRHQAVAWMWTLIDGGLRTRFQENPRVKQRLDSILHAVAHGSQTPATASKTLLGYFDGTSRNGEPH
jgi:LAO/AO transport system kinase